MTTDPAGLTTVRILTELVRGFTGNFIVRLWEGSTWQSASGPATFTLVLRHPGALRAMFGPFREALGDSYIFGDFDIEGDMLGFGELLRHFVLEGGRLGLWEKLRLVRAFLKLPRQKQPRDASHSGRPASGTRSAAQDREAIQYTYDLPGELYQLFLDRNMQYTCGYFADPDEDLDAAQERKMDHICRKLRLKPGERFIDFGCGWGDLLVHAATRYGVEAVGVTLSAEQARWAERTIASAGLTDRARVVLSDYREFKDPAAFDKAASVGMTEHVGPRNLPAFYGKVHDCLRPGGAYLHHSITLRSHVPPPAWTPFMKKYVFPNAEIPTLLDVLSSSALAGFETRDVENLREHYVLTLAHWLRRLEINHEQVVKLAGEVRYRIFRMYMAGGAVGFRTGVYNLHQCLLVRPDEGRSGQPLTRADWYS